MNMVDWNYLLCSHSVKLSSDYLRGIAKTISGSKNYRDALTLP